jgi:hypothetical protein
MGRANFVKWLAHPQWYMTTACSRFLGYFTPSHLTTPFEGSKLVKSPLTVVLVLSSTRLPEYWTLRYFARLLYPGVQTNQVRFRYIHH